MVLCILFEPGGGAKLTDKAVKAFVAKGERGKKLADDVFIEYLE